MLRSAGRVADDVLLWAVPQSDLDRSVAAVHQGYDSLPTSAGESGGEPVPAIDPDRPFPGLIWAPIIRGGDHSDGLLSRAATYAVLNNRPALRKSWGVAPANVDRIRELLVSGRPQDAAALVPQAVVDDLATERDLNGAVTIAARIGATGMAVAATDLWRVAEDVQWARKVMEAASAGRETTV